MWVTNEPSVVAIDVNSGKILQVGLEAKRMVGKTPASIVATRPLKDGVIADYDIALAMLKYSWQSNGRRRFVKPRIVVEFLRVRPKSKERRSSMPVLKREPRRSFS